MVITIPYKPREAFQDFHDSGKRFMVLVCHRAAGKTVATINHLIRAALLKTGGIYAFISPTYTQGKRTAWAYLKDFSRPIPDVKFNEAELKVEFPNRSCIYLLGAENPNSLRGMHLDGVVFDEYSQQPPNIFGEIIRPAVASKRGFVIWIGTLVGKNHLWKLWNENRINPEWFTMYLRASESKLLPEKELELARASMSPEEYAQEYELEPSAAIRGSIYADLVAVARKEGRIRLVQHDKFLPVDTVWDLGIDDSTAIWCYQTVASEIRIIDSYEMRGVGLDSHVSWLKSKPYRYGTHWLPHDIKVRELSTGRSRFEILQSLMPQDQINIIPKIAHGTKTEVEEGINALRMIFNRLWINESLDSLIAALEHYHREWDDELGVFRPKPLHDWSSHHADCGRYLAVVSSLADSSFTSTRLGGTMEDVTSPLNDQDSLIQW